MNFGRLNKRVTIQAQANTDDGMGGQVQGWTDVATVWASVAPQSTGRPFVQGGFQTTISHKVIVRYRAGVQPGQRLVHDGRTLRIVSVIDPNEGHAMLELLCDESPAGAG